jgi:hypothetical protein
MRPSEADPRQQLTPADERAGAVFRFARHQ